MDDGRSVLLKMPWRQRPGSTELELLARECELIRRLPLPGIPSECQFLRFSTTCALVFDDCGGVSLQQLVGTSQSDLGAFFRAAIQLAAIVGELHRRDIVHNAIQPKTILFNPESKALRLVDFTLATTSGGEFRPMLPTHVLRSILAYMSPEQTGRMNRRTDYRSDFYSLGVVFYELLTGAHPYTSGDPLELIHWHIARTPPAPSELAPEVPGPVSEIVMKLLAKSADDRYQSALGLLDDLETCASEWGTRRSVTSFTLGRRDISDRLLIPQRLYGREAEIQELARVFESVVRGGTAMMLVAGYPGIGKTVLIQEMYGPIVRKRGHFTAGKFDQIVRNIPYGALIQALKGLLGQLLTGSEENLRDWRRRLLDALGPNGGVLAEVIPEIELILGKQPAPALLGPAETQNRFRLVFQNFIGAVARQEHPLVVFLDDLQWADPATLNLLLPLLTSPDLKHLLLIGAYRDSEVGPTHPLTRTLSSLEQARGRLFRMSLAPLSVDDLSLLLKDALHRELPAVLPLAEIILRKTGGNAFFVVQFLKTLRQDGFLTFDYTQAQWGFDVPAIERAPMTDNVIDLMTRKIQRLSSGGQRILTLAACVGSPFDLDTLAVVSEFSPREVARRLNEALAEGLVLYQNRSPRAAVSGEPETIETAGYEFLHDRVQQAAYSLIPPEQRMLVHLTVGRLLRDREERASAEENLFDIAHHLNLGRSLITDANERLALARLNASAGRRAKSSTAYQCALTYLRAGIGLLAEDRWQSDYDLMWNLHLEAAECEYLCGHFAEAENCFDLLLVQARTNLDKAQIHNLRVVQYENTSRYADAVACGREGLALFGLLFPETIAEKQAALETELSRIQSLLEGRTVDALADLPTMEDPEKRSVMRLLTSVWASAYILGDQLLTRLISSTMVSLSLECGNTEESAYGYVTHAITVGPVRGDYESAYQWGSLALSVNERFNDPKRRAKIHQQFNAHVNLWRRPMQTCIPHAREACRSGLETGDFTYAGYGAFTESWPALLTSQDLDRFVREYSPNLALLEKIRMTGLAAALKVILNWARALQGRTSDKLSLSDDDFDERAYLKDFGTNPFFATFYHVAKLYLHFAFEAYDEALEAARRAREVVSALGGTIWPVLLDFLYGLTVASLHRDATDEQRRVWLAEAADVQQSLELLARNCPENFSCFSLLLRAELCRMGKRDLEAMTAYEEAIRYARATGSLPNQGLSNELYARFWDARGNEAIAALYLGEACRAYEKWGAAAKVADLEERYSLAREAGATRNPISLDIHTVAKAAHAISVEIVLEDLLRRLMQIALENAGAQRGIFLENKGDSLVIQAEAEVGGDEARVLKAKPFEQAGNLSCAVVRYAWHTGGSVVVGDVPSDERFAGDPYIVSARPRSILCVPVKHQGKFAGVLYLENNLTRDAFTGERVEVIQILCSQAAISLANARAYEEIRQEAERRRRAEEELRDALLEVQSLKKRLEAENIYLQEEIRREHNFEEIVGNSPALLEVLKNVEQVAPADSTVLIFGETGTGKELIARAIHSHSGRQERPLVSVNCGAISAGLVESELFGHVKGAFTGALERRVGRFEIADGGTLFLDEVSELPLETQVKLLRVLQLGEFEPVGSSKTSRVDVRIIAATNRDLEAEVRAGRFRTDLYYRLNVVPLRVPPLRERPEDIRPLVMFFLSRLSKKSGKGIHAVSEETMKRLAAYSWPGNIRELQNVLERAVVLSPGPVLSLDSNFVPVTGSAQPRRMVAAAPTEAVLPTLEENERSHILAALEQSRWVIEGARGAARILNLHPNTLRSRMKKLGIHRLGHEIS